ncbi:O-antigen ligase family protein [Halomonas saccharevitans]|uniref:O-antigen ligase family protein n=1 Tax=Halomonas saccharevitans TaxID=416872 RepID=A0ABU3NAS0_9GAMM|nr:O-antigen ligase family protein [Halomonas saccharevitans]MDT8878300.1 O-antigen ligase family protein [Halomonas saccharevitans]
MESGRQVFWNGWRAKNHALGWVALSVYAFSWLISFDLSRAAESVFILCFVIAWCSEPDPAIKWNRVFLLLLAFVLLQVWVHFFAVDRFPAFSDLQLKAARHMTKLFLCIAVAWWLRGVVKAAKYLLLVFLAGIVVSLLMNSSVEEWMAGLSGSRVDFGYTNAQHTAFFLGLLLIVGVGWLYRCLCCERSKVEWGAAFTLTLLGLVGVVVTQTRAVLLALTLILLGLLVVKLVNLLRQGALSWFRPRLLLPLFVLVGAFVLIVNSIVPTIENRLSDENEVNVVQSILDGKLDDVPYSSIGNRVHSWVYGWERVQERPLTGWGARSRTPLMDEGPFPEWVKRVYGHFHNSYLEILLAYGFLGMLILGLLTSMILKGTLVLFDRVQRYWGVGLLTTWVFFFIINLFESYLIFNSGMYFFIIVGGVGVSFYLFDGSEMSRGAAR